MQPGPIKPPANGGWYFIIMSEIHLERLRFPAEVRPPLGNGQFSFVELNFQYKYWRNSHFVCDY